MSNVLSEGIVPAPTTGTEDDDDDREDEHEGENEAPIREINEQTEAPDEFEVDDEIEQPLVSANSNHVSRRYVTEYGIGEFKPKTHFLSKKQQMRWSPAGAHYLLQVCAELLNGTLLDGYRTANPRFRGPSGFSHGRPSYAAGF
jgi:hypothetical protein